MVFASFPHVSFDHTYWSRENHDLFSSDYILASLILRTSRKRFRESSPSTSFFATIAYYHRMKFQIVLVTLLLRPLLASLSIDYNYTWELNGIRLYYRESLSVPKRSSMMAIDHLDHRIRIMMSHSYDFEVVIQDGKRSRSRVLCGKRRRGLSLIPSLVRCTISGLGSTQRALFMALIPSGDPLRHYGKGIKLHNLTRPEFYRILVVRGETSSDATNHPKLVAYSLGCITYIASSHHLHGFVAYLRYERDGNNGDRLLLSLVPDMRLFIPLLLTHGRVCSIPTSVCPPASSPVLVVEVEALRDTLHHSYSSMHTPCDAQSRLSKVGATLCISMNIENMGIMQVRWGGLPQFDTVTRVSILTEQNICYRIEVASVVGSIVPQSQCPLFESWERHFEPFPHYSSSKTLYSSKTLHNCR
ncbi:hypothetical protein VNO77_03127 [Canavalia gladiata]|uniref:Uncharacterized protein n=1 Tax=Canavalia gladiata TaxID=3824 RepID=A0AAN9MU75_CANGL